MFEPKERERFVLHLAKPSELVCRFLRGKHRAGTLLAEAQSIQTRAGNMNQRALREELTSGLGATGESAGANTLENDEGIFDSLLSTVRANPIASLAAGAAIFALSRTPAGRVIKPALSLAISSGAASAIANAVVKQISRK